MAGGGAKTNTRITRTPFLWDLGCIPPIPPLSERLAANNGPAAHRTWFLVIYWATFPFFPFSTFFPISSHALYGSGASPRAREDSLLRSQLPQSYAAQYDGYFVILRGDVDSYSVYEEDDTVFLQGHPQNDYVHILGQGYTKTMTIVTCSEHCSELKLLLTPSGWQYIIGECSQTLRSYRRLSRVLLIAVALGTHFVQ